MARKKAVDYAKALGIQDKPDKKDRHAIMAMVTDDQREPVDYIKVSRWWNRAKNSFMIGKKEK